MATATFTTIADKATGDTFTEAMYDDYLKDNVNQLAGAHRNLLVNGGMEVWQRGAGGFTTSVYTADRWLQTISAGTSTVTQETSVVDTSSGNSLKIVTVGGPSIVTISQKLEHLAQLRGRTLAVSARVQQSVASGATVSITASGGSATSSASATTGAFVTMTTSLAVGAADAGPLNVTFNFTTAGTYYIDNVMLVVGPAPAPYQPLHPQEDLARCQRYYEIHGGQNNAFPSVSGYAAAGSENIRTNVAWQVTKGGNPTVTKNGTWGVTNCGQPAIQGAHPNGYTLQCVSSAAGQCLSTPNSTDDTITGEWNP